MSNCPLPCTHLLITTTAGTVDGTDPWIAAASTNALDKTSHLALSLVSAQQFAWTLCQPAVLACHAACAPMSRAG